MEWRAWRFLASLQAWEVALSCWAGFKPGTGFGCCFGHSSWYGQLELSWLEAWYVCPALHLDKIRLDVNSTEALFVVIADIKGNSRILDLHGPGGGEGKREKQS